MKCNPILIVLTALMFGGTSAAHAQRAAADPQPAERPEAPAAPEDVAELQRELREAQKELRKMTNRITRLSKRIGVASEKDALVYLSESKRAIIGIVIGSNGEGDATITGITPGSAAEEGGVKSGDRILEVNGIEIGPGKRGVSDTFDAIGKLEEGDQVTLVLERNGDQERKVLTARRQAPKTWWTMLDGNEIRVPDLDVTIAPDVMKNVEAQLKVLRMGKTKLWPEHLMSMGSGIEVTSVSDGLEKYFNTDQGALVLSVSENFPGLEPGDVCKSVDGETVKDARSFWKILNKRTPGDVAQLEVVRDGAPVMVDVEIPERELMSGFSYQFSTDSDCEDQD